MVIADALRIATERLSASSDTARLDAELLMAHALGVSRSDLLLRHMREPEPESYAALVERRAGHEPVAYITGEQEFYGRPFRVSPAVLIPRGDSEVLIEAALDTGIAQGRVLDLGTGSGALLLTLLLERPAMEGVGIDASLPAALIAMQNSLALGVNPEAELLDGAKGPTDSVAVGKIGRARIIQSSWRKPGWADTLGRFDLILCNPPYVEDNAVLTPSVRDHEPASALFAGPEGLDDYRIVIPQLPALLARGGVAILEIGHRQAVAVSAIAEAAGFAVSLRKDLGGRDRAIILQKAH
ncbi:MAG: peptide chain release factor N(5)-glutamine methyltransferase [Sphingomonadaceae bacterium]|nr:peptide chain release factor N(5)-glutamine methyltransferase [Sphingomonadaceae bacterium]